ncbi:MraY family glycosyltransferase [Fusibacter sp. 3D3]|uniref:MraY family glycosyltransferase n=1 Tax=Fusibacter sp. 3D3 TaxID=1048380 RepID=UPI000853ED71|nr:MraY family glycosyltransferase [Fusibacter sp. 3D3]GAU75719.1 undecaprenyl-phosphate N-acetylglucosaminyl 1-phosphate transferase [Fusibacter sp. 3D3]
MDMYISALLAGVISFLCTPLVIKMAHRFGAIDIPKDDRRVHNKPIPLWGGVAIFTGFFVSMFLFSDIHTTKLFGLFMGSIVVLVTGMVDDVRPLGAKTKLFMQFVAASILVFSGFEINFLTNFFGSSEYIYFGMFSIPVSIIWIVGVTNTVNLIDGLDGLAAGISAIAAITLGYIAFINHRYDAATITLILAGSSLGFLPYNFNPAKIFMGDAGALFLGLVLSAISIEGALKGATALTVVVPIIALGVPIFDTAFAIVRRLINKRPIMEADKGHLHHRFLSIGYNQRKAVLSIYLIGALMGAGAIALLKGELIGAGILLTLAAVVVFIPLNKVKEIEKEAEQVTVESK